MKLKIGFYGFGAIGRLAARVALDGGHEISGAIDVREDMIGKDVGELLGREALGVKVSNDISSLIDSDVIIHATGSYLDKVFDQLFSLIRIGAPIVSSCETLAYPYYRYPVLSVRLNDFASRMGVPIIGTGVNPGFILDTLVAVIASSSPTVRRINVVRSLDAFKRREPFRKKVGVGEDPKVVEEMLKRGEITGHVGYAESVLLIAQAGDLNLTRVEEGSQLVVAEEDVEHEGMKVAKGKNLGMRGYGSGFLGSREVIRVELHAYAGAPDFEEILVEGKDYKILWKSTGTPGDLGTASILISTAEKIIDEDPGLHLMTELLPFKIRFER
ncbi:MAG: dihydrodipicolinate reductase [Fervidicoccaceae archaeon]